MPKKRKNPVKLLLLIALAVAAWWGWRHFPQEKEPISGTIEVDEAHVGSRYGGRVVNLPHVEGDELKKGDLIAELDAEELQARRDLAAAQLEEMEHGPRPSEIDAAKHDWESLKAQLVFAKADAARDRELLQHKTISPAEAQKADSTEKSLEQSAEAARQRYDLLCEGTRPERIAQARAQLADIEAQLKETRILAPSHAILEVLSVKVGDIIAPNREVATLILPDYLWMRVYVPAVWLEKLALGQDAELRVDGDPNTVFHGVIEQINRQAEFTPRNVQTAEDRIAQVFGVKIRLDNSSGKLRAGMSGEVTFPRVTPASSPSVKPFSLTQLWRRQ